MRWHVALQVCVSQIRRKYAMACYPLGSHTTDLKSLCDNPLSYSGTPRDGIQDPKEAGDQSAQFSTTTAGHTPQIQRLQ
ncbi:hypothetical protein CHS0354_015612 [Potamilus streckersoni]|uniref:Uncharacterized protein n=1 Tax=Potamilus streckersoni TaxID=2493646 RepID=A0AAE0TCX5_9BIVA|nr:hypothetical protein CHS0354_015612 [Potamilus streckersoni]